MAFQVNNSITAFEAAVYCVLIGQDIEYLIECGVIECPSEFLWDEEEISKYMPRARRFVLEQRLDTEDAEGFNPTAHAAWLNFCHMQAAKGD